MFKHILVPSDGSPLSQDTLSRAASFAREAGARVTVFFAQPEPPASYDGFGAIGYEHLPQEAQERLNEAAREILDDAETRIREAGVPCERKVLIGNKPWALIIEAAESQGCDLIFMASHGRRGIAGLVLGSETRKVLTHSKIPGLVCRGLPGTRSRILRKRKGSRQRAQKKGAASAPPTPTERLYEESGQAQKPCQKPVADVSSAQAKYASRLSGVA